LHAELLQMRLGLGQFVGLARGDGHARAHLAQGLRHLQAEPARAAGDERRLAGQIEELLDRHHATSNRPAAPCPPPMHMVTTTYLAPRRLPSISAWPVSRLPVTP